MIRKKRWFAILYMFVVTAFFSTIVIGFSRYTRPRVEANQALAFERAVVEALPGLYEPGMTRMQIHSTFVQDVSEPDESSGDAYVLRKQGQTVAYALPFVGEGFWDTIRGVVGIKADKRTVTGIRFYQQSETPGLGAEITTEDFTQQFESKVLASGKQPLEFERPGATLGESQVHAVTGATQTSNRVEIIVNNAIVDWRNAMGEE